MKAALLAGLFALCFLGSCIRTSFPIPKPPSGSPGSPDTSGTPGTPGQTSYSLQWQKVLAGLQIEGLVQTADGGFAGAGQLNNKAWVFRLDAARNLVWQKQVGRNYKDVGTSIIATADGGFVVAGSSESDGTGGYPGPNDGFVFKVDANGNTVWQHAYGSSDEDYFVNIISTADGGFLCAGMAGKGDGDITDFHGGGDLWIVKLDANGNKVSSTTYGGPSEESFGIVRASQDGGYVLTGRTYGAGGEVPGNKGGIDIVVFKLDASLNIVWGKNYGGSLDETNMGLTATADGGCLVVGDASSNDGDVSGNHGSNSMTSDAWVLKLDKNGQIQWQKCYGGTSYEDFMGVVVTSDGGYMLSGETYSNDGDVTSLRGYSDFWLAKIDGTGKLIWQKSYGSSQPDEGRCLIPTADGGFASGGYVGGIDGDASGGSGTAWLIEIK